VHKIFSKSVHILLRKPLDKQTDTQKRTPFCGGDKKTPQRRPLYHDKKAQWLLSPQIWKTKLGTTSLPQFWAEVPPISDSSFSIHFGLLSPLGEGFVKGVVCQVKKGGSEK